MEGGSDLRVNQALVYGHRAKWAELEPTLFCLASEPKFMVFANLPSGSFTQRNDPFMPGPRREQHLQIIACLFLSCFWGVIPVYDKCFLHFLWKDLPSLQPFQEEGRKWEELQVPELQSCQQGALTQSPSPGEEPGCGV